jgi:dihydroorotate dehydrogenase
MYQIIKNILFLFDPEAIHRLVLVSLKAFRFIPFSSVLLRTFFMPKNKENSIEVFGLQFKNRVGLAAGFDKNASHIDDLANFGFSFIEVGAITPEAQKGNPKPRLFRLPKDKALINRMGFNNKGVVNAIKNLKKRKSDIIVGANLGKNTQTSNDKANDDYISLFKQLHKYVDYFTINVSCPNVKDLRSLQDEDNLLELLSALKQINSRKRKPKPILLKISPDLTFEQLDETLEVIAKTKIDGIVAVNTTTSRTNLTYPAQKIINFGNGGLSGLPLKNRATEMIHYIYIKTEGKLPIIGVGGIFTKADAQEKFEAGATLIQVFTGFVYEGPSIVKNIVD